MFSENIGIFSFTTEEHAKRSSVNRPAGTLETKPITFIGRDMRRFFLLTKVLLTILEKWPSSNIDKLIRIQQDNARTHISPGDEEFRLAISRRVLNIQLTC